MAIEGIAWTPDGRSLVYAASAEGVAGFRLWQIPAAGGTGPERLELTGPGVVWHPAVSPTGNRLAYARFEVDFDIWRFEAGASPQRVVSSTRTDCDPQFSPDGKRIVFATSRSAKGSELWIANRDGTNLVRLTEGAGRGKGSPRWSPDGRSIAFDAQAEDGVFRVYLIDAAGGQPRRLSSGASQELRPTWSRDGKWVYFNSDRSGSAEVWRVPAAGGEAAQITHGGGEEAVESADGKTLYYRRDKRLFARPLAGGEERQVLGSLPGFSFDVVADGIYHALPRSEADPSGFEIRFLDFATGKDQVLHRSEFVGLQGLTVSPDRKTILYCASAGYNADLMLVENFR
jgi:Tol biopolymer transport system component